jgi:hypothetical protein
MDGELKEGFASSFFLLTWPGSCQDGWVHAHVFEVVDPRRNRALNHLFTQYVSIVTVRAMILGLYSILHL